MIITERDGTRTVTKRFDVINPDEVTIEGKTYTPEKVTIIWRQDHGIDSTGVSVMLTATLRRPRADDETGHTFWYSDLSADPHWPEWLDSTIEENRPW